jgi:hypothetical protein
MVRVGPEAQHLLFVSEGLRERAKGNLLHSVYKNT